MASPRAFGAAADPPPRDDARPAIEAGRLDLRRFALDLGDEQLAMREAAEQFARERVAPGAVERDRSRAYPLELVTELAQMGLLAMKVPVDDGGAGADNVAYALAMQAIAQACASIAVILASSNLVAKTTARRDGDDWVIDGSKHWITSGAHAGLFLVYATEACGRVVDRMLQLHGGYGYSEEYQIERLYRDARITRIYEGANEIQRLIGARGILGS